MPDKPVSVERVGIEHVPEAERHGSPGRVFTLWFAANLTIADYVIGVLVVSPGFASASGLTVAQSIPIFLLGNLLGGLVVGLSAAMGPKLGFPQMLSSRISFGRKGNYLFGGLNWISTVGWFTVNTILGVIAIQVVCPVNFFAAAALLVAVQVVIAVYGHDFIHLFEKVMSVVLGLLFLGILVVSLPKAGNAFSSGSASVLSLGAVGTVLAVSFSYLMSWSPYASDYSRYLPFSTSKRNVTLLALIGGASASFGIEVIGAIVGTANPSSSFFGGLYSFAGGFGPLAILALVLGAIAANALNIYTNALSALVLDVKVKRWLLVVVGGIVGLGLAFAGQENFANNYQSFLLILDYWIMPWFGIVLVDFYFSHRASAESISKVAPWDGKVLAVYLVSVLASVPFMVPPVSLPSPIGSLSGAFGGADFSYFISFGIALVLTFSVRKWTGVTLPVGPSPGLTSGKTVPK